MDWLPLWNKTLWCSKVQSLPGDVFKAWVNLIMFANLINADGDLPSMEDIHFALHLDHETLKRFIEIMVSAGLVDRDTDEQDKTSVRLSIHDWGQWQIKPAKSTDRVRRFRERSKKKSRETQGNACNVSETRGNEGNDETPKRRGEDKRREGEKMPPQKDETFHKLPPIRSPNTEADQRAIALATERWGASNGDSTVGDLLRTYEPDLVIEAMNRHWDKQGAKIKPALLRGACEGMFNDGWKLSDRANGQHGRPKSREDMLPDIPLDPNSPYKDIKRGY